MEITLVKESHENLSRNERTKTLESPDLSSCWEYPEEKIIFNIVILRIRIKNGKQILLGGIRGKFNFILDLLFPALFLNITRKHNRLLLFVGWMDFYYFGFLDVHDMVFKHTIFMFSYYDCNKQFEMCLLFCIILHFIYKYDFS